jgi:hypothetical protein
LLKQYALKESKKTVRLASSGTEVVISGLDMRVVSSCSPCRGEAGLGQGTCRARGMAAA